MEKKQQVILLHGYQALTANMKDGAQILTQGEVAIFNAETAKDAQIYATTSKDELVAFPSKVYVDEAISGVSGVASGIDARLTQAEKDIDALEAADITIKSSIQENAGAIAQEKKDREDAVKAINSAFTAYTAATDGTIAALDERVGNIEADYLTSTDKSELQGNINTEKGRVDAIVADYLKAADKNELSAATSQVATDLAAVDVRVKAVEADYLKAADKNELQDNINIEKGRVDAIVADYLKAADKNELSAATSQVATDLAAHISSANNTYATKTELEAVETGLTETINTKVDTTAFTEYVNTTAPAEFAKKADKAAFETHISNTELHVTKDNQDRWNEAATAIETFLDENVVADNVIDTLVEIRDFLTSEDGTVEKLLGDVAANATAITENAESIAAIEKTISELNNTYATDAELEAVETGLTETINTKLDTTAFTEYTAATNTTINTLATKEALSGVDTRLQTVEGDYLKAADKSELQGNINTEKGRVDAIVADYLKAADKSELSAATSQVATDLAAHISNASTTYATKTELEAVETGLTETINNGLATKVDTTAFTEYTAATNTTINTLATKEALSGVDTRLQTVENSYVKEIVWANGTLTPESNVIDMSTITIDCGTY